MNAIKISNHFIFKSFSDQSVLLKSLKSKKSQRDLLESMTRDQSGNVVWHMARTNRLTASNFGRVVHFGDASFVNCSDSEIEKKKTLPMNWGIKNESTARELYEKKHDVVVDKIGFLLSESGILGGTPDGIVKAEKKLIEIKCPFTLALEKNRGKLQNFVEGGKYWLKKNRDGKIVFNMGHKQGIAYYHQIQGCLYLAEDLADSCDLVVWGPEDWLEINVTKNHDWFLCYGSYLEHYWKIQVAPVICQHNKRMVSVC